MPDFVVPIREVNGDSWGSLAMIADAWEIVGERVNSKGDLSFADGHRVRHYVFRKNVHFKITATMTLNISDVPAAEAPKGAPRRRHNKR